MKLSAPVEVKTLSYRPLLSRQGFLPMQIDGYEIAWVDEHGNTWVGVHGQVEGNRRIEQARKEGLLKIP